MQVDFFAPAPWDTVSGGYVYDRAIVDGLRALGHDVRVTALDGLHPLPDDVARTAAAHAWDAVGPRVAVIDGLCLPAFAALPLNCAVGLVHHPTALETGRTVDARTRLRDIEQALFPRLARIVVTSDDTAARLVAAFGVAAERITVVEPGTPDAPRSDGPAGASCMILAVASLIPRKGYDVLLRALARLTDLDWTLCIVGPTPDPAHAASLLTLCNDCRISERVTFAGALTAAEMAPLWARAAIFASATHYEGYGMAIAEALRRGVPVAVTAGGAAAALVTPECAAVCATGDHEQLSKALRRMIYDRPLRCQMAEAAWRIGRSLPDWETQARRFAEILESV